MRTLISIFCLIATSAFSQPTIHVGSGLAFLGDYRVAESVIGSSAWPCVAPGQRGNIVFWSSLLTIDPVFGSGSAEWSVTDDPCVVNVLEDAFDYTGSGSSAGTWYPTEHFYSPLPSGYSDPTAQWITNSSATLWIPNSGPYQTWTPFGPSLAIGPYSTGTYWIDIYHHKLRVVHSTNPPKNFGQ